MLDYFVNNFSDYIWIAIILIAMIPSLEGRIALPFALSLSNFGIEEIPVIVAFLCTFVGSIIPCLPVIVLCRAVKKRSSGFLYDKMISRLKFNNSETEKINKKNTSIKKMFLLGGFVAIPLPLTGVWTGSLIAGFSSLKLWQSFLSICIGSLISCIIILCACLLFGDSVIYLLIISLIILIITIISNIFLRRKA